MKPQPDDVIRAARHYVGVRWRHQGRTADGLDCVGLLVRVAGDLGFTVEDETHYSHEPSAALLLAKLRAHCDEIPSPSYQPGDVVLMSIGGSPRHVGIVSDRGLIHAAALYRKVVEHEFSKEWRDRVVRAFRWKETV